jgi:DNA-binding transcriptional regulator GbsR (MarR family)
MEVELTQSQKELIERFGVFVERSGLTPVQARIIGLLMVCDTAELTFEEIYNTLKVSKSAVSNAVNSLLQIERIQYHTKPGDRKRYFSTRIGTTEADFEKNFNKLLEAKILFREILSVRPETTREFNNNLQRAILFMDFLENELPEVYKKWRTLNP